jgi:hypothetical protein
MVGKLEAEMVTGRSPRGKAEVKNDEDISLFLLNVFMD